ncbi:MAG TPA: IS110 family transposase [Candidatus Angelobacter sp.]|nr:IS110 family transposase [Candidatus Angelobacter sp.]
MAWKKSKKKQPKHAGQGGAVPSLSCIEPNAAGIDIGATEIFVALPQDRDPSPVRRFETFTEDLHRLKDWLRQHGITTVAMESTGVYWIPLFQILERAGIEVCLVNAHHVKHVPGRKTDIIDCQWLQYLHSVGLLRASFRPEDRVCAIRSLLRHRDSLVQMATVHVQHMQKALTQMNLQIHHVLSDITGQSGLAILQAMVKGERNPVVLAQLRDYRVKASEEVIVKSLVGDYRREHLFTLGQSLEAFRYYQSLMATCDEEIEEQLQTFDRPLPPEAPPLPPDPNAHRRRKNEFHFDMRSELYRILGVDVTAVPAIHALTGYTLLAEVGTDWLTKFRNMEAFASWACFCPHNKKSGGKILSAKTRKSANRVNRALRVAAQSLERDKSHLGNYYRKMCARLGKPAGITATAHKLARILFHMITTKQPYDESIFAAEEQRQRKRMESKLKRKAHQMGYTLVPLAQTI